MAGKVLLGVLPCPCCKEISLEIRPDRSGAAFGYCPLCSQQLRVGAGRDAMFRANWGLPAGNDAPVTVTDTDAGGAGESSGGGPAVEEPPAATVTEPEPAAPPKKKRATCLLDD